MKKHQLLSISGLFTSLLLSLLTFSITGLQSRGQTIYANETYTRPTFLRHIPALQWYEFINPTNTLEKQFFLSESDLTKYLFEDQLKVVPANSIGSYRIIGERGFEPNVYTFDKFPMINNVSYRWYAYERQTLIDEIQKVFINPTTSVFSSIHNIVDKRTVSPLFDSPINENRLFSFFEEFDLFPSSKPNFEYTIKNLSSNPIQQILTNATLQTGYKLSPSIYEVSIIDRNTQLIIDHYEVEILLRSAINSNNDFVTSTLNYGNRIEDLLSNNNSIYHLNDANSTFRIKSLAPKFLYQINRTNNNTESYLSSVNNYPIVAETVINIPNEGTNQYRFAFVDLTQNSRIIIFQTTINNAKILYESNSPIDFIEIRDMQTLKILINKANSGVNLAKYEGLVPKSIKIFYNGNIIINDNNLSNNSNFPSANNFFEYEFYLSGRYQVQLNYNRDGFDSKTYDLDFGLLYLEEFDQSKKEWGERKSLNDNNQSGNVFNTYRLVSTSKDDEEERLLLNRNAKLNITVTQTDIETGTAVVSNSEFNPNAFKLSDFFNDPSLNNLFGKSINRIFEFRIMMAEVKVTPTLTTSEPITLGFSYHFNNRKSSFYYYADQDKVEQPNLQSIIKNNSNSFNFEDVIGEFETFDMQFNLDPITKTYAHKTDTEMQVELREKLSCIPPLIDSENGNSLNYEFCTHFYLILDKEGYSTLKINNTIVTFDSVGTSGVVYKENSNKIQSYQDNQYLLVIIDLAGFIENIEVELNSKFGTKSNISINFNRRLYESKNFWSLFDVVMNNNRIGLVLFSMALIFGILLIILVKKIIDYINTLRF